MSDSDHCFRHLKLEARIAYGRFRSSDWCLAVRLSFVQSSTFAVRSNHRCPMPFPQCLKLAEPAGQPSRARLTAQQSPILAAMPRWPQFERLTDPTALRKKVRHSDRAAQSELSHRVTQVRSFRCSALKYFGRLKALMLNRSRPRLHFEWTTYRSNRWLIVERSTKMGLRRARSFARPGCCRPMRRQLRPRECHLR